MATVARIGPADHGRPMTLDEYLTGDYLEGYRYELIDGKLYVSPEANFPEGWVHNWLRRKVQQYADGHPEVLGYVTGPARVFVPGRPGVTTPEPDVAAYRRLPRRRLRAIRWQDLRPVLLAEVLSASDPGKDLVRNVELYLLVPSVKEYWVIDARMNPELPRLRVHRRRGRQWRVTDVEPGAVYTTPLLPGLELLLDTRR